MLNIESFVKKTFSEVGYYGNPPTDYQVSCPFCGDDSHKHLHISMVKRVCHCFKCGYSSSWVGLVMDVTGLPYHMAIGELYQRASLVGKTSLYDLFLSEAKHIDTEELSKVELPKDFVPLHAAQGSASEPYKKYMKRRGFGEEYWLRYNIGFAPSITLRVIIPIEYDYWQGRAIQDWLEPKYINPKSDAARVIFNSAALEMYKEVVICEGAFSAMAVGSNAIALIGKECPEEKLKRLLNAPVQHYIISLEPGAFPTMYKMMDALANNGKQVTVWNYTQGDPADPRGKFEEIPYSIKSKIEMSLKFPKHKFNKIRA